MGCAITDTGNPVSRVGRAGRPWIGRGRGCHLPRKSRGAHVTGGRGRWRPRPSRRLMRMRRPKAFKQNGDPVHVPANGSELAVVAARLNNELV